MGFRGVINVILRKQIEMSRSFSLFQPPTQQLQDVHAPFVFLNYSYFFNASIITFSKKKNFGKKKGYPRPSTWNPRQKDRLAQQW